MSTPTSHQRHMDASGTAVLWQLQISHYVEKVRWALDYKQVPHIRRSLLPGPELVVPLFTHGDPRAAGGKSAELTGAEAAKPTRARTRTRPDPIATTKE